MGMPEQDDDFFQAKKQTYVGVCKLFLYSVLVIGATLLLMARFLT